jgi:tetratricopeptide (TPR) repeat protein
VSIRNPLILLLFVVSWLVGCTPRTTVIDNVTPAEAVAPQHTAPSAIDTLLQQAYTSKAAADYDRAASVLERALQIEPRNALVWFRLAEARLAQGQYQQAEAAAQRSRILAPSNLALQGSNWSLIERVRRLQGDEAGAQEAAQQAEALQWQDNPSIQKSGH